LHNLIRSAGSTSARQRLHRPQLSLVELVVAPALDGNSHIGIFERRRHGSEVCGTKQSMNRPRFIDTNILLYSIMLIANLILLILY